jgi:hypothetical protein
MKALLYAGILFLFACNQASNKTAGDTKSSPKDSIPEKELLTDIFYIDVGHYEFPGYSIDLKAKYWDSRKPITFRDSSYYYEATMLYIKDKKTYKQDSVDLGIDYYNSTDIQTIKDFSDSLGFKSRLLYITWIGDSDMDTGEFVECTKDTCKVLFQIDELYSIRRKDAYTLEGFVWRQDEVLGWRHNDYPFTVSLKDNEVQYIEPPIQYIGNSTEALETIQAYRIKGGHDSIPYTIQKGTSIMVDTLYRTTNNVRLTIQDSIIIHIDLEKLQGKIQVNTAG